MAKGNLSILQVETEFKELVNDQWDWQVRKLSETDFPIVFPSKETLRLTMRGGGIRLPRCELEALVLEAAVNQQVAEVLVELWVLLHGVPAPLRHAGRLIYGAREIGRPIAGDEYSLINPKAPVRELRSDAGPSSTCGAHYPLRQLPRVPYQGESGAEPEGGTSSASAPAAHQGQQ
jgi:hypothetical protein